APPLRGCGLGDIRPGVELSGQLVEAVPELVGCPGQVADASADLLQKALDRANGILESVARLLHLAQARDEDVLELALTDEVGPKQPEQDPAPEDAKPA